MKSFFFLLAVAVALVYTQPDSFASDYPEYTADVVGGYTFRQYVTLKGDHKTLLAAKGVLYIARKPFSKAEIEQVRKARFGKLALAVGHTWVTTGGANVCVAIIPVNVDLGVPMLYPPLAITRARGTGAKIDIVLISFPDAWFGWRIKRSDHSVSIQPFPQSELQWHWTTKRFEVTPNPGLNLSKCLQYSQAHIEDVQKARVETKNNWPYKKN